MTWRIAVARVTIGQPEAMKAEFIDEGLHAQGLDTHAVWNSVLHRSHDGRDRRACDGSHGLTVNEAFGAQAPSYGVRRAKRAYVRYIAPKVGDSDPDTPAFGSAGIYQYGEHVGELSQGWLA